MLLDPADGFRRRVFSFEHREQVGVDQVGHLKGRTCRSGTGMRAGHAENCLTRPTAPRRLFVLGVNTMLFLPSRMGRTSTTPPSDNPEASRHHFGRVLCPTFETVSVSSSF